MRLLACLFLVAAVGLSCVATQDHVPTPRADTAGLGGIPASVGDIFNRF